MKGRNNTTITRKAKIAASKKAKIVPSVTAAPVATAKTETAPPSTEPARVVELELVNNVQKKVEANKFAVMTFRAPAQQEPLTREAHQWMTHPLSIPGAGFAPYRYIGWRTVNDIAETLKRQITLEEAQCLVQADGPKVMCPVKHIEYQPIRYWPYCPRTLIEDMVAGKRFSDIPGFYGGCFFFHTRSQTVIPMSGSRFEGDGLSLAFTSPLIIAAQEVAAVRGDKRRFVWGNSLAVIEKFARDRIEKRQQRQAERRETVDGVRAALGIRARPATSVNLRPGERLNNQFAEGLNGFHARK